MIQTSARGHLDGELEMRKVLALSLFLSFQIVWAQDPEGRRRQPASTGGELQRRMQQQAFESWASIPGPDKAVKAEEEARVREFYEKARRFVVLWQTFAATLSDQKTFDAKLAKQVSKAFHDMEKSDGWPVGRSK
jgi:hypothetical protein